MRLIDADAFFEFLTDQLEKGTGAYSKGRNQGIHIARSALHDYRITPTIDNTSEKENHMILIHELVNGRVEASYKFSDSDKESARRKYAEFQERLDCYAQVIVDGHPLNTAEARRYFGLPKIRTPRNVKSR